MLVMRRISVRVVLTFVTRLWDTHDLPSADTQFAYLAGIRDFVLNKKDYLLSQVGNPEGDDKPNKKVCIRYPFSWFQGSFVLSSTTTPVSGFVRVRRPSLPASRRRVLTSAMSVRIVFLAALQRTCAYNARIIDRL